MNAFFPSLLALAVLAQAGAIGISGAVVGTPAPDTRLGAWVVSAFGEPQGQVADSSLSNATFKLEVPATPPQDKWLAPVGNDLTWPGLVDFAGASVPARAAELRFFTYRDSNGNSKRDETEPLREVRLNGGKSDLFVVWLSAATSVKGGGGYQADLQAGWNVMLVEVRKTVRVAPYTGTELQINLGK